MSLPQLLGGAGAADCAAPNPLAALAGHADVDRSLSAGAAAGPAGNAAAYVSSQRAHDAAAAAANARAMGAGAGREAELMARMRDEQRRGLAGPTPAAFRFHDLRSAIPHAGAPAASASAQWADDFLAGPSSMGANTSAHMHALEAAERARFEQAFGEAARADAAGWAADFLHPSAAAATAAAALQQPQSAADEAEMERIYTEGARVAEADAWADSFAEGRADQWVDEFTRQQAASAPAVDAKDLPMLAAQVIDNVGGSKLAKSNFIAFMRQVRDGAVRIEGSALVAGDGTAVPASTNWADEFSKSQATSGPAGWAQEFVATSASTAAIVATDDVDDVTSWAEQYTLSDRDRAAAPPPPVGTTRPADVPAWEQAYMNSIRPLLDDEESARWQTVSKGWTQYKFDGWGYEGYNKELYQTYRPSANNPFLAAPAYANLPLEAERAASQGHVAESVLAWEAAVAREPSNATAWFRLGQMQALSGDDELAIPALHKAVALQPTLLDAWINLAASYANENARPEAFQALEGWLRNHDKYPALPDSANFRADPDRHRGLVDLFLAAARQAPGPEMDTDVQIALGLLFNMSNEGSKAVDCFTAAARSRPNDPTIWNRLGASMANSGKPELAVDAYHKALELSPNFVRARTNLGISCIALGALTQAAEHILMAIAMQRSTTAPPPAVLGQQWSTLRMIFLMMERGDLADKCDRGDVEAFHADFDF